VRAGKIAFDVKNQGSSKVTGFSVDQNNATLGSVDKVAAGSSKTLTMTLKTGSYDMRCAHGTDTERASLTVTDRDVSTSTTPTPATGPSGSGQPQQRGGGGVTPGVTTSPNMTTAR
jgi:hypothetical protein